MRKILYVFLLILFSPSIITALDVDTIFVWDNDRGNSIQTRPAVGVFGGGSDGGFAAWQDGRWGDFDIFRQRFIWEGSLIGFNTMVSFDDYNQFQQANVDVTANPQNGFIAVWEDSAYLPNEKPAQIWCRIHDDEPIKVYELDASQKLPAISSRMDGYFAVSWTSYYGSPMPSILCKYYDEKGNELGFNVVRQRDSIVTYPPISRVAYCDSGFIIVYEDESNDGTERSIYAQYCDRDGNIKMDREKISRLSGDSRHEQCPDVAINEDGNIVVVWEDYRLGDADIYIQCLQAYNDKFVFVGSEMKIMATGGVDELCPRVAVFPDGSFVVVWYDKRNGDFDAFYRAFIGGELRTPHRIPETNFNNQMYPNIDNRYGEYSELMSIVWASQAFSTYEDVFMRIFKYDDQAGTGLDSLTGDIPLVPINPDTVGGRKGWYFDNEDYDNPNTPAWDEDPIPEPESVYVDLEYAIVDQIMELNTNGQYFVVCAETLPGRERTLLSAYEAVFLDLGYRTSTSSAGVITTDEQNDLVDYIDPSVGDGKPTMVEGNDFGYMYDGTTLYKLYRSDYKGDGAPYTTGNIDTLYGLSGMFAEGETLKYDYHDLVDNYVDSINAIDPARNILRSTNGSKRWTAINSVGYGLGWKQRAQGSTIYNSFMLSSIKSNTHPHTYAEYYRRCLGFLGLNCQPEPITTLEAYTGSSEGQVTINWQVVSDDELDESAEGDYKLKFAREKMESEAAFNNAEEYYQTWNTKDSAVGVWVSQDLYGLPPLDTLIFALKVSDESALWDALGAEPQAVVEGDSITPHTITVGDNYVKDFMNKYEYINRRNDDSLFVTWDGSNFYMGFARCNFRIEGDLFIYIDVTSGGADSTYPYQGAATRSCFRPVGSTFKPDYCFILEDDGTYYFKQCIAKGSRDSWVDAFFNGSYSEDNVVNGYLYFEVSIPFSDIGYITSNPFKLIVLAQNETTNEIINAYPIFNPLGTSVNLTQYYYWAALPSGVVPNKTVQIIGIEEETLILDPKLMGKNLAVFPNPFSRKIELSFGLTQWEQNIELKIYDITGRLVKQFKDLTIHPVPTSTGGVQPFYQVYWDGTDNNDNSLPKGIYFCEFVAGERTEIEKIIYIK